MRLFEIIVVIAAVFCSILWLIGRGTPLVRLLLAGAISVVAVIQWFVEGYRTAMLPIDVLSGCLLLYAAWRWWKPAKPAKPAVLPRKRKALRRFLLVLFSLYVVLAALLPALVPVFQLPKPDGPFAVGTKSFSWAYKSNGDAAHDVLPEDTSLSIQFWYPADPIGGAQTVPYAMDQTLQAAAEESGLPAWLFDSLKLVKTSVVQNAPVSSRQTSYPVIVFAPGERIPVISYSGLLQELASQGFIVVSIGLVEPTVEENLVTSQTSSDLAVGAFWLPKIHFVLDQLAQVNQDAQVGGVLAGKLDLQHIGMLGHSYGGTAVALALQQEPRLKAGIDMDGIFYGAAQITDGVGKPFLYMNTTSSRQGYSAQVVSGGPAQYNLYRAVLARKPAVLKHGGYELTIDGIWHLGFSDFDYYSPVLALLSPLNQTQAYHIIGSYATAFFQQYLENEPSSLLAPANRPFPQAVLRQEA